MPQPKVARRSSTTMTSRIHRAGFAGSDHSAGTWRGKRQLTFLAEEPGRTAQSDDQSAAPKMTYKNFIRPYGIGMPLLLALLALLVRSVCGPVGKH